MISASKASRKRLEKLVHAAERLAAVQYEAGLHSSQRKQRIEKKVNRCWQEFRVACDVVLQDHAPIPTILVKWRR